MIKRSSIILVLCLAVFLPQTYAENIFLEDTSIQQALPVIKGLNDIIIELNKITFEILDNYLYAEHISGSDKANLRIINERLSALSEFCNREKHTLILYCLMKEKYKPKFCRGESLKIKERKMFNIDPHIHGYRYYRMLINNPAAFQLVDKAANIVFKQLPEIYNRLEQFYEKYDGVK